ncbi:fibronectin type III domain-containing protein [Candidatus Rariloculus sp.]|uniref:fibronectin type III domain-containing protein n=1 Tax=Candidatus Rariloculus sp. TaxID=3101265 RepID=UPI003D0CC51C
MTARTQPNPRIQWDGTTWLVRLPVQDGNILEAKWNPGLTYVVRVREAGTDAWSFGFETPLTHFSFIDLKPDTEYEMQVRAKNAAGEGEPSLIRMRTNPAGSTDNVIPFPKR